MAREISDLIWELAREAARAELPGLTAKIAELSARRRQILESFPSLGRIRKPAPRSNRPTKMTPGEAGKILSRYRKQQGSVKRSRKKEYLTPGRARHAAHMRRLHADPVWRARRGLPPPKKGKK